VHLVSLLKENMLKRQNYLLGHFSGAKRCPYQIIARLMWECFQGLLIANFCLIFLNWSLLCIRKAYFKKWWEEVLQNDSCLVRSATQIHLLLRPSLFSTH